MQTALLTFMASNSSERPAEAVSSGPGLRIDSALRSKKTDTLFTKILHEGIDAGAPVTPEGGAEQVVSTDEDSTANQEESADVCSILAQLAVMNASGQPGGAENENVKNVNGILGVINEVDTIDTELKGLEHAASVILQNDGKAAEVLTAKAAARSAAAIKEGQETGTTAGTSTDTVLSGITEAIKNELSQSGTTGAATTVAATTVAATTGAAADTAAVVGSALQNPGIASGIKENKPASANNDGSKTAILTEELSAAASVGASENKAAVAAANGSRSNNNDTGAGGDTSGDNGLFTRDKHEANEAGTAVNGANQIQGGAEVIGETTAEKTAAIERALNRFTNDLRSLRSGNQEVRIILEPESLGVLIISVMKTDSGISAKIKSEDKEVVAIISDQLQKLVAAMQNKGIKVNDLDVVHSQAEQNTGFTQHGFSQARDESSRGYKPSAELDREADASNSDVWQNFYGGETDSDATVDYRV